MALHLLTSLRCRLVSVTLYADWPSSGHHSSERKFSASPCCSARSCGSLQHGTERTHARTQSQGDALCRAKAIEPQASSDS
jgi:hypothetical protein